MSWNRRIPQGALLGAALAALGVIAGSAVLVAAFHPLHLRSGRLGYTLLLALSFAAWMVAIRIADSVPGWAIGAFVLGTAVVTVLGPPEHLTDIWNYLGYARLGALHHLSPYSHVIGQEAGDPVFRHTSWRDLSSPYGPLFTAITYPIALLPIGAAYWALKLLAVAAAVATLAAVGWAASLLGRDWRRPVVLVAANPVYLFFELNGFHNDFVMLLPATLAVALVLAGRERAAGVAIAVAVAVKFTAIMLLPFLLLYTFIDAGAGRDPLGHAAAPAGGRWLRLLAGGLVAALALAGLDVWLFGFSVPNLSGQSGLVTGFSGPNLVGLALGLGGATTAVERGVNAAVVVIVVGLLWRVRNGRDWLAGGAWATLALTASLAWLMPWYLVWTLPLAALGETPWLRRAVAAATAFVLLTAAPSAGVLARDVHFDPMAGRVDQAAIAHQRALQGLKRRRRVLEREPLPESAAYAAVVRAPRSKQRRAQRFGVDSFRHG